VSDNINQDIAIRGEGNIVVGKGDVIINPIPPAEERLRHDLRILLKNVETTWIKGVLEKSVHEAALLDLGMELRAEAVDNPWRMVMESPDQSRETLPRGRKIKDIFYEANGLLLILGEPGSGKTTTLLQLARDLIADVDQAFTQPVSVILNLSTWTNKQQPLDEWLIAELNSKYRLPKKDGQRWLKERRILPLLDGLDEVRAENRAACVEKINQLVVDYGLQGLVVCSRIKDYTDLNVRLAFYRAIYIQPLSPEQVDEYLQRAGEKLASLRATLQADEALRSMAQSPLILNIMSLAYQNTSAEDLNNPALNTDRARRKHLFDTYIARMFSRKAGARPYSDEQTKSWLSWLSGNMQWHNQDVFMIENLQPSWLSARHWKWLYLLASRLVSGVSVVLILELATQLNWLSYLTFGLIVGLTIGFIDVLRFEWLQKPTGMGKLLAFWRPVINIVVIGLIVGLIYGMVFDLIDKLFFGLIFGFMFGLRGSRQSPEIDIQTVEALLWSWRKASVGGLMGVGVGLIYGAILGLSESPGYAPSVRLYHVGQEVLFVSLTLGPVAMLLNGLRREIIETKSVPNQGIWLSTRNAIFGGLLVGISVGLSVGLINVTYLSNALSVLLALVSIASIGFGLLGALWYGGLDVIQHYTLRLILVIQRHTPANYARFLDYAVDRIFLQKVGGGYRFIHRLLLEHFADMDIELSSIKA
jgi:DNA polymerase III delta prime subunit